MSLPPRSIRALALLTLAPPACYAAPAGPSVGGSIGIVVLLLILAGALAWVKKTKGGSLFKTQGKDASIEIKSAQSLPFGDRAYILNASGSTVLVVISKSGQVSSTPLPTQPPTPVASDRKGDSLL